MPFTPPSQNNNVQKNNKPEIVKPGQNQWDQYTRQSQQQAEYTKSVYQQNMAQPVNNKWYAGDIPTSREIYGRIYDISKTDPTAAAEVSRGFEQSRLDPSSPWYAPYTQPTNQAVNSLRELGFDTNNLSREWVEANRGWIQDNLIFSGTTNSPTKPGKKATADQQLAYQLYQWDKSENDTEKAEQEWTALQEEAGYMAKDPNHNYSPEQIIESIYGKDGEKFAKKYPMLASLDSSLSQIGGIRELNRGINYSKDNLNTVIWRARNDGGTGNWDADMALSVLGGNQWTDNPEINAKLNKNDLNTYSPYSVGMTLGEEGRYFDMYSFTQEDIDRIGLTLDWDDKTASDMIQKVQKAEDFTAKAEDELSKLNQKIDAWVKAGTSEERIKKNIDNYMSGNCPSLLSMDKSLKSRELIGTTRAINYRYDDMIRKMYDDCAERDGSPSAYDEVYGAVGSATGGNGVSDVTANSTIKAQDTALSDANSVLGDDQTSGESAHMTNAGTVAWPSMVEMWDGFKAAVSKEGSGLNEEFFNNQIAETNSQYTKSAFEASRIINDYENTEKRYEQSVQKYGELSGLYGDFEYVGKELSPAPTITVPLNGKEVQIMLQKDMQTGEYVFGSAGYIDHLNLVTSGSNRFYDQIGSKEDFDKIVNDTVKHYNDYAKKVQEVNSRGIVMSDEDKGNLEQLYTVRAQMERDADYLKEHKSEYDDAVKTEQKARDSFYRSYSMLNDLGVATDGGKDHLSLINSATAFGKKQPKEKYAYSDVDMLDEAMRGTVVTDANGKKEIPHEAMDYVTSQKAEDQEQIKDIQYMLDYFGEDLPQEYRSNMQAQIASLEQDIKEYDYFLLQTNDDWEELVAKGEALDPQMHQTIKAMYWDNMTQEEKDRYHYLLARDGRDTAAEYYQYLSGDGAGKLAKRQTQDLVESARLATQENPFLANYIAIATSPLSSVGSLISLIYTAATGESAGDTPFMMFNNIANAVNEETTMQIQNAYKDNPTAQKIVQGVYEIVYNRGRSVMNALSFPFLGELGEFAGALPMATTAMADEVMKAKEAGAEDWQAWTLGAVALLCEAGTEMIELGDIKQARELGLNPLTGIKDFLKQYPIAGFSEALGESLNDILEGVADYLVLGDEGEFNERVWNYQTTMGLSKEDAEAMAIKDEIYNVLHTAVISYLSPGLDVFSFASGKVALYNHYNRQANQYNTSVRDIRSNEQVKAQYAEESGSIESKIKNGEVPTIDFGKLDALDKDYISSMETLESAKGKHRVTTRSSAIASSLKTDNTPESADVANAAAVNADNTFGDGVSEIQTIFDGGRRAGLDINQIRKGIQYATLGGENSASSQLVQSDEFKNATPDRKAEMLIEAASLDDQNQGVQQTVADNVYENRIAEKEKELRANGSMNGTVKAADEAMKASAETQQARDDLETKQAETEAAVQANQAAVNAVNENASKDNLDQVEKTAVEVGQRDESAQQYEQHLNKTQEAEAQKKEDLKTIKQQEKSSERQQAEQMLAEEDKQREADKKQAEQQKIANENATEANEEIVSEQETAADREARIRQRLQEANYTGEDLERQVRRIMDYAEQKSRKKVDTKARLSDADGDKFLRTISRHTGVTYEMQDLGDPLKTRGYIIDRNHIVLNSRLTRGQALVEAALHEYTHGAEGTKAYEKYANFVINAMYANKQSQYEEDLKTKMRENASLWKDLSYEEKRTRARQELVADYARLNLAKKEFIRGITAQGLGGKFREYLSNAISLLKGYTLDAEGRAKYQELRTAMKLFKEAIDERARHTEQSNNGHTGLIQASISGWTDATGLTLEVTDDDNHVYKLYSNGTEIKPGEYKADMVNGTPVGNLISMAAKTRIETLTNKLERGKITQDQFDKQLSEISKTASQQREYVAQIINMIGQYQDAAMVWELAGSLAFSSLKTNGDPQYSDSYDFGTICTKTQAILNAISQTQVDLGRALTKEEIDGIVYEEVGKGVQKDGKWIHGATPCPPCYVYATWVNKPARLEMVRQFQNEMSGWTNEQINEFMNRPEPVGKTKSETTQLTKDQNSRKLWISLCLADQVKDNETGETRWVRKENPDICPNDILLDLRRSGDMATQHPGTWTFMQKGGNAQGKAIAPYSGARLGETIVGKAIGAGELNARLLEDERNAGNDDYIPQFLNPFLSSDEADQTKAEEYFKKAIQKIKAQNLKGGQRWQSWSDFRAEWGSDYLMEMITMQALGSQVQTYTKVVEALDLLASAGFEVNMSLMPYGDGFWHNEDGSIKIDEDGNLMLRFSPVTGINPEAAEEYAKKYGEKGNVQPMVVGISDEHIKAALAGNYITFVIPFHGSGGSVKRLQHLMSLLHEQMESGNDYTKAQSDTFETGKTNTNPTWLLREKILTGECENATDEELDAIYANEFLTKLYEDRYINEDSDAFGVYFSKGEAQQIYPYEYWDTNTTLATADINSQRFIDYCQMMGVVPRFSGLTKSDGTEYANFSGRSVDENGNVTYNPVKGYWKLLIDRSMYNRVYDENGKIIPEKCTYHKPQVVSTADINVGAMPMAANNTVGHSDDDTREIAERIVQRVQMKNGQNAAAGSAVDLQQNANTINNVIHEGSEVQNSSLSDLSESEMDDIIRVTDEHYERAVENGDMEEAQRLVDQKAEESGYTIKVYHGTANGGHFTIFDPKKLNNSKLSSYIGQGFYFTNSESGAREYMKNSDINGRLTAGRDSHLFKGYIKLQNPIEITEDSHNIPYDVVRSIIADGDKAWFFNNGIAHDLQGTEINGKKYTKEEISSMSRDEKIDLYTQHLIENGDRYALQHMVDAYSYENQDLLLEAMKNHTGNDGIHWQMHDGLDQFVVFDSSQFKESDPITYDDNGDVIPLSERFRTDHNETWKDNDFRYSRLGDLSEAEMDMILNDIDSEESKLPGPPTTLPRTPVGETGSAQRRFGNKTAQESDALHQEVKDYLYTHSDYTPDSNRDQINRAMDWVRSKANDSDPDGYRAALEEVLDPSFDYRSADGQARMLTVMSMAALKARDGDQGAMADELRLADAYNQQGTDLGRQLQARKIFRLMTPLGRRMSLQQEVARINQDYKNNGKDTQVKLSEDVLKAAEEAQTEEDFEKVRKAAAKELAEQMPANWKEKLQTWRMLSMLANTRTHIRNVLGNAIFMPTVGLKNAIGAGLESIFVKEGGERTKAIRYTDDAKAFAKEDVKRMQDMLTGEAKYSPEGRIDQNKKAFGQGKGILSRTIGKGVQAIADANSWALEKEDWIFLSKHYQNALASYMTANGLTSADMKGSTLEKARNYAVLEAQKATYRDANAVSTWLNKASRRGGVGGFLVDTVLPFKKTPANILRRGIEYSPVGLLHSLATARKSLDLYESWTANGRKGAMPKGAKSMTEVLDKISSGMTGTMIAGLGALGYALGAVKLGFGGDDDDELEKERGSQEYSVELFGHSFTIDWAAPVCMPFFTGAALYKEFSEMGNVDDAEDVAGMVGRFINSLGSISEPVFNLSMLDGVSSLLKSAGSTQKDKIPVWELLQNIGANYVGSLVPSASGALARTIDTTRRQNYVEPGDPLRIWKQKIEQAENKIPWLSMRNIPYRDVWGEADVSAPVEAFLENFILPGYLNKMSDEKLTQELQRVYDQTGAASVIPKTASKTVGTKKLTDQEYDKYVVTRGQTAKQLLNDLIGRDEFIALTPTDQSEGNPEAQVNLIGEVWKYANAVARHEIDPTYTMDKWIASAYADGDPVGMIFAREEEKAQKAYGSQMKTDLFTAITGQDAEAIGACLEGMKQAGEDNKSIRTSVMNNFRDQYKEAYRNGDQETMDAIMYGMLYLDLEDQSFTDEDDPKSIFNTWKKSVDKGE